MGPGMMRMLMVMNTAGEGARSLEKMQAVHARRFAAMDGNDVGRLSPEEMEGFIHGEAEERPRRPDPTGETVRPLGRRRTGGRTQASSCTRRSLSALPITETDDRLIAAAAKIGEIKSPRNG